MKVYLIGYMGVGKSSLGRKLARKLSLSFIDTDEFIEETISMRISDFFDKKGEGEFRKLETEVLKNLSSKPEGYVMSTGGGMPTFGDNIQRMLDTGIVVWLKMSPARIVSRLNQGETDRPLVKDRQGDDLYRFVAKHLEERMPYYSKAHIHYPAASLDSAALDALTESILTYSK